MGMREPYSSVNVPDAPRPRGTGDSSGVVDRIQQSAGEVKEKVADTAGQVKDQVADVAAPVVDQAQEKAGQVFDQAREQASSLVDSQKDVVAEAVDGLARAIRQTGTQLRLQEQTGMAGFTDQAAERIERVAGYLREHDTNQLFDEAEHFARRRPGMFLGGGFLLGMLAARFLKSSASKARPNRALALRSTYQTHPYATQAYDTHPYGMGSTPPTTAPPSYGAPSTSYDVPRRGMESTGTSTGTTSSPMPAPTVPTDQRIGYAPADSGSTAGAGLSMKPEDSPKAETTYGTEPSPTASGSSGRTAAYPSSERGGRSSDLEA